MRWLARLNHRWLIASLGLAAVALLVREAGAAAVWENLKRAAPFLPLIAVGELGLVTMDVASLRHLYGEHARSVPARVWFTSAIAAYTLMVFAPSGRSVGELARASRLAPYLGGARSLAGAVVNQGAFLWGNALICIACWVAISAVGGRTSALALLVAGNGLLATVIGTLLFSARRSTVGAMLGRRISAISAQGAQFDRCLGELPAVPLISIGAALCSRLAQTLEYAFILLAVGGKVSLGSTLVAQGIHLVGAGMGDLVPNQFGVTEGAYRLFAGELGLSNAVASAVAIAMVHRLCQFGLAGLCLLAAERAPVAALEPAAEV